jgi:hypothetical protein
MSLRHICVWASIGCTCQMLGVEIELEVKTECDKKHGKVVHIAPLPMPGPPCCCTFMPSGRPRCCMFMPPGLPGPPLLFLGVAVLMRSTVSDCGCACNRLVRYNLYSVVGESYLPNSSLSMLNKSAANVGTLCRLGIGRCSFSDSLGTLRSPSEWPDPC